MAASIFLSAKSVPKKQADTLSAIIKKVPGLGTFFPGPGTFLGNVKIKCFIWPFFSIFYVIFAIFSIFYVILSLFCPHPTPPTPHPTPIISLYLNMLRLNVGNVGKN